MRLFLAGVAVGVSLEFGLRVLVGWLAIGAPGWH